MSRILVLGKNGQVGHALTRLLGLEAFSFGRDEADFSDPVGMRKMIQRMHPTAIINAAAYTAVDQAEQDEAKAMQVNGVAPGILAEAARDLKIPLVHYSTDYVFDGSGESPRTEEDVPNPLNAYGRSKLAGEKAIMESGCDHLILRTSWVYDAEGKNFFNTMLRLGAEWETLSVVADQVGAPTYALHLADRTLSALRIARNMHEFPAGLYHLCGKGETSWHNFAAQIFSLAREEGLPVTVRELNAITSEQYPMPAKRPLNSRLSCAKIEKRFGVVMPHWGVGLSSAMATKVKLAVHENAD